MDLRDYARIARKYGWLLVLVTALGVGAGQGAAMLQSPTYAASTRVFVSVQSGETTTDLAQGSSYTQSRVASYASLAASERVLDDVATSLGLSEDSWTLARRLTASIVPDTTIIEITATGDDPVAAAELADATAASLADTVDALEARPGLPSPIQLALVESARVPDAPASPRPLLYMTLGGLIGFVLAAVAALVRGALDTRIHTERDLAAVTDAPLLGAIAHDPKVKQRRLIVHSDPLNPRAEAFRTLRTSLQFLEVDAESRSFVVTSPSAGMGKSTTAMNLALALADAGRSVVLVDADLRRPKIAEYAGIEGSVGLTDVLIGRAALVDVVQPWGGTTLSILPAGQVPPNPSELLGSLAMARLVETLGTRYEWVLFDTPPLLPVTDAAVLSEHVSAVVMIASAGHVTGHQLDLAAQRLRSVGSEVGGVVLTMVPLRAADAYGYGHYASSYRSAVDDSDAAVEPRRAGHPRSRRTPREA